jgi:hypothetical protein
VRQDQEPLRVHRLEHGPRDVLGHEHLAQLAAVRRRGGLVAVRPAEHPGVDGVRAQAGHPDPAVPVVEREPLGEAERAVLGHRVAGARRPGDQRRRRDRLEQVALATGEHRRHDRARRPDVRHEVHVDDAPPGVRRLAEIPRRRVGEAGVRAEDADRAERILRGPHQAFDRVRVGDVAADAHAADPRGHLVRPLRVDVCDDHAAGAFGRETLGERLPDSAGPARHDHGFAGDLHPRTTILLARLTMI